MLIFSLLKINMLHPQLSSLQMVLSMENSNTNHDMLIIQKQTKLSSPHFLLTPWPSSLRIQPTVQVQAFGKDLLHTPAWEDREGPEADLVVLEPWSQDGQFPRGPKHLQTRWLPHYILRHPEQQGQASVLKMPATWAFVISSFAAESQLCF